MMVKLSIVTGGNYVWVKKSIAFLESYLENGRKSEAPAAFQKFIKDKPGTMKCIIST
jgi:hypothetical protein